MLFKGIISSQGEQILSFKGSPFLKGVTIDKNHSSFSLCPFDVCDYFSVLWCRGLVCNVIVVFPDHTHLLFLCSPLQTLCFSLARPLNNKTSSHILELARFSGNQEGYHLRVPITFNKSLL